MENRSIILFPFSLIWRFITGSRNFLYNTGILKSFVFDIPVICIGNLVAGGTGKTPHAEYVIDLLKESFNVAFLSRGYKRKKRGFAFAGPASKVIDIGDEPMQVFRKFPGITVAVDSNRVRGVNIILKERPETDLIILDDGFQHRRIKPGFSVLLSDFERPVIRDHLLPYGNLRESIRNMARADIIIITKSPEELSPAQQILTVKEINIAPYQNIYFTTYNYKNPVPVFDNITDMTDQLAGSASDERGIVLVTGIANPKPLIRYLKKSYSEIVTLSFGDHHTFTMRDIKKIHNAWYNLNSHLKYVFTTEKDAVRLREFINIDEPLRSSFFYIPVEVKFLVNNKKEFDNLIIDYVRKNNRNNRVS